MSRSNNSWWASSSASAKRTAFGAAGIALSLTAVCYFVWISPANPVAQVRDNIAAVVQPGGADLKGERNRLLSRTVALEAKLDSRNARISRLTTDLATAEKKYAEVKASTLIDTAPSPTTKPVPKPIAKPAPKPPITPEVITAPTKAEIVSPASRYLGLYTTQAPFSWATYDETAAEVGSKPSVVGYFGGWDEPFRANAVTRAWGRDTLPMLTWESRPIKAPNSENEAPDYELPDILGDAAAGIPGKYDGYLHQYAKDIVATGLPLAIRFNHEMNGTWYPWSETKDSGARINGNSKGDYAKVWKHVHDIFEQEGANSLVVWVWAPNIINNLPPAHQTVDFLKGLYPGDAYVDWVGLSGYLRPAYKPENNFTFGYTFDRSLDQLRAITNKPIFLAEVGASETGGHKPAWITSLFDGLGAAKNSDIIGVAWFNLAVTSHVEGELATNDWRIGSRPESLVAFKEGLVKLKDSFDLTPIP